MGTLIGALMMRTLPGQTKADFLLEFFLWIGGGLFAGVLLDYTFTKVRSKLLRRGAGWFFVIAIIVIAVTTGNEVLLVLLSLAACTAIFFLLRADKRSQASAADDRQTEVP